MSEKLTDANQNPWYVLAPVFGEQKEDAKPWDYDEELAAKNRRAWNGWFCDGLSEAARAGRAKKAKLGSGPINPAPSARDQFLP